MIETVAVPSPIVALAALLSVTVNVSPSSSSVSSVIETESSAVVVPAVTVAIPFDTAV